RNVECSLEDSRWTRGKVLQPYKGRSSAVASGDRGMGAPVRGSSPGVGDVEVGGGMWPRFEKQLDAEIRFHLDELIQKYMEQGLTRNEARQRALREFGAVELAKDEVRDLQPFEWFLQFGRDLRVASRVACRAPAFAAAVVATLAIAIGSAVAVFGVVYA